MFAYDYIKNMDFNDDPDYDLLIKIFKSIIEDQKASTPRLKLDIL
jgi:hypothetical protein